MQTIDKISLKADNFEFWEVSIGDSCYVRNVSKSKVYTFIVKTRASTFEGGVMPNSLRVVSHNLGKASYLRPLTVQITSSD